MNDFIPQVLELARDLQAHAPSANQDPKDWMKKADDFADICMPRGQLAPQLFTGISLRDQGDFVRHIKAIKAAAGSYNSGLRTNIDEGLTFIVKTLGRETQVEAKPVFSVSSIPALASRLSPVQRKLFDEVWNYFVASGKPFPFRSLPRIVGKQSIEEALRGLNGGLIYETTEQGDRCFKLTMYGAFLTSYGAVLAALLVRLLDLVKELYESDTFIKLIDRALVMNKLELSPADAQLLVKLLNLGLPRGMPVHLASWGNDGNTWTISITDDVISLYRSDDTVAYLDERLSAGYRPDEPYSYDERLRRDLQRDAAAMNALPGLDVMSHRRSLLQVPSYVSELRLEELRKISNPSFDCTRLICMCEELNECAARQNAHSVIMLTRAILDHVAPVFGFKKFKEVASNYAGGGESFRKSIERLENHSRKVADRLLHMPIRDKEVAPTMEEVSFAAELETMLAELCRRMK